jgi:putative ABC transport system ATP-binding protein
MDEFMSSSNNTIISCSNITKRFSSRGKQIDVLCDISFSVKAGQIIVIQGRSGTGKSTLLQILAGLERLDSGQIVIEGKHIEKLSSEKLAILRRQTIGFIFQNFNLIPSWTALENVEAALINTKISRDERRKRACELLDELDMADRVDHLPSELSIGQQQRVAIARALINTPKIVFADEPTGDVDPQTAESIFRQLVGIVRKYQSSLIICTHGDLHRQMADRLYLLENGKITEQKLGSN